MYKDTHKGIKTMSNNKSIRERLAMVALKAALYGYLTLTIFALGYFTTFYSDGILFEIEGIASYWIDFGGELTNKG